jgi:hypothetical protein
MVALETKCVALQTDIGLSRILLKGVHGWMQHHELLRINDYPAKYRTLISQQNSLRWRQLFNGRMSKEWARLQDDHLYIMAQRRQDLSHSTTVSVTATQVQGNLSRRTGKNWTTEIITELWAQWALVRAMRNAELHGHDEATRLQQRTLLDRQRLEALYAKRMDVEPRIRDLLFDTIEEHMHKSPRTVHNWLAIHKDTILQSIKQAAKRAIQA